MSPVAQYRREPLGVVVVAAGESSRMAGVDKIFAPLLGKPLIAHTIDTLESCSLVAGIVLVLSPGMEELGRALAAERGWRKLVPEGICTGGPRRQDSVRLGLECLGGNSYLWVAVHDGARPCVSPDLLERGLDAAQKTGAAVAAVPAKDTIKRVSPTGFVDSTLPRDSLWLVQTPQVFSYSLLHQAHRDCQETVTDDASMLEGLGHRVKVFMGSYTNIKVTTPEDLALAEVFLKSGGVVVSGA